MSRNVQLLWIAEAEARQLQETTRAQRAPSEPPISVIAAVRGAASGNRWRRLIAQLMTATASDETVDEPAPPQPAKEAADPAPPRLVVCPPTAGAFDDRRS